MEEIAEKNENTRGGSSKLKINQFKLIIDSGWSIHNIVERYESDKWTWILTQKKWYRQISLQLGINPQKQTKPWNVRKIASELVSSNSFKIWSGN